MDGGLVILRQTLDSLSPSEKKIGEYILDHPHEATRLSVGELAQRSGGSQAAVVRLAKSMGLKGFPELKLKIAGDLALAKQDVYEDFVPGKSMTVLIDHISDKNSQSIVDTKKVLDPALVEKAAERLNRARKIHFYGMGISNLIAQDAHNKFARINKSCFSSPDPDLQLISALSLGEEDVAVGISSSGKTKQVVACLKAARDAGACTISITRYGTNEASRLADIPLFISSIESEIHSGAVASRIAQLNVIDILYIASASLDYDRSIAYLEQVKEVVGKQKE